MHRDLSSLNIMITHDGECVLSDWDHAGTLDQHARGVVSTSTTVIVKSP